MLRQAAMTGKRRGAEKFPMPPPPDRMQALPVKKAVGNVQEQPRLRTCRAGSAFHPARMPSISLAVILAPVAHLDRASRFEREGTGFKSWRARQTPQMRFYFDPDLWKYGVRVKTLHPSSFIGRPSLPSCGFPNCSRQSFLPATAAKPNRADAHCLGVRSRCNRFRSKR